MKSKGYYNSFQTTKEAHACKKNSSTCNIKRRGIYFYEKEMQELNAQYLELITQQEQYKMDGNGQGLPQRITSFLPPLSQVIQLTRSFTKCLGERIRSRGEETQVIYRCEKLRALPSILKSSERTVLSEKLRALSIILKSSVRMVLQGRTPDIVYSMIQMLHCTYSLSKVSYVQCSPQYVLTKGQYILGTTPVVPYHISSLKDKGVRTVRKGWTWVYASKLLRVLGHKQGLRSFVIRSCFI